MPPDKGEAVISVRPRQGTTRARRSDRSGSMVKEMKAGRQRTNQAMSPKSIWQQASMPAAPDGAGRGHLDDNIRSGDQAERHGIRLSGVHNHQPVHVLAQHE